MNRVYVNAEFRTPRHEPDRSPMMDRRFAERTVQTFGFDGVRIDAGHLMKPDFVLEMREASGVFGIAEFLVQVPTYQQRTQITAQIQVNNQRRV